MAFVATSAPSGWKLGRWTNTSGTAWQEEKLDNPQIVYQFQAVSGQGGMPGSSTVRLKMKDQNTEVLLLESSAQVFVKGVYFGEYGGSWQAAAPAGRQQGGSKGQAPAAKAQAPAPAAAGRGAPAPAEAPAPAAAGRGGSKKGAAAAQPEQQGDAFEQTLAPAQAQKSAPPKRAPPPERAAPPPQRAEPSLGVTAAPDRASFQPAPEIDVPKGPRKAEGLDKSDKSMAKLIDAAKTGDASKVQACLDEGIDPDGPARDGKTPLMAATSGGHMAVVEKLLGACADPTLGKGDETPLTIAFQKGNQALLKVLFNASFTTMNTALGPGIIDVAETGIRSDNQEVPDNVYSELRGVTQMIAKVNARDRPGSPEGHEKYGNYASLAAKCDTEDKDSELMRTEAVRLQMKSLSKTNKEGGLGQVVSPGRD